MPQPGTRYATCTGVPAATPAWWQSLARMRAHSFGWWRPARWPWYGRRVGGLRPHGRLQGGERTMRPAVAVVAALVLPGAVAAPAAQAAPTVQTGGALITSMSVTLGGSVNPQGVATAWSV